MGNAIPSSSETSLDRDVDSKKIISTPEDFKKFIENSKERNCNILVYKNMPELREYNKILVRSGMDNWTSTAEEVQFKDCDPNFVRLYRQKHHYPRIKRIFMDQYPYNP